MPLLSKTVRGRLVFLIPCVIALAVGSQVAACGGSEGEDGGGGGPVNPVGPGGPGDDLDAVPLGEAGGSETSTGAGSVTGVLLERSSRAPMAGRALKLRDATGKVVDLVTDANGGFTSSVASPYDVWVSPSGATADATSALYLGLRAAKIRVFAGDAANPPIAKHAAKIPLSYQVPGCTGGACKMNLVGRTPDGSQQRGLHPGLGPILRNDELAPIWTGPSPTTVQITLLLTGLDGASHYMATATVNIGNGQSIPTTLTPQPMGTTGQATLAVVTTAPPSFGTPSGVVRLALPGDSGELEIATGSLASPLSFSVPTLAGSSLRFFATQLFSGATFQAVSGAQVGVTPAASSFSISVGQAFPLVAPQAGANLSVANGVVEYRPSTEPRTRLAQLVRGDGRSIYVWHAEEKLALSRLTGLVLPLTPSATELVVEEHARALDDFVSDMAAEANDRASTSSVGITLLK